MRLRWLSILVVTSLACGDEGDDLDAGGSADAGQADTGSSPDSGTDADAGTQDTGSSDTGVQGMKIEAEAETWTWVPFPESRCMNDTPTGIGVNLAPGATQAIIFLQGGNACFNQSSCAITANPNGYGPSEFEREIGQYAGRSAFARDTPENPFSEAHFVYVPYCTGDVHAGTRTNAPLNGAMHQFVGHTNLQRYLDRLVPTLEGVEDVVLVGVSAGGFGAALNYDLVQQRFGEEVRVTLIDDSGPPMGNAFIAPCLQKHFRELWGLDEGPLARCPSCDTDPEGAFVEDFFAYTLFTYPNRNLGVVSYDQDQVIRGFWGFGENECANLNALFPPNYPGAKFTEALEDLRDRIMSGLPNAKLFMVEGTSHVLLTQDPWTVVRDGVTLSDWIQAAMDDDPSWESVPAAP